MNFDEYESKRLEIEHEEQSYLDILHEKAELARRDADRAESEYVKAKRRALMLGESAAEFYQEPFIDPNAGVFGAGVDPEINENNTGALFQPWNR